MPKILIEQQSAIDKVREAHIAVHQASLVVLATKTAWEEAKQEFKNTREALYEAEAQLRWMVYRDLPEYSESEMHGAMGG